MYLDLGNPLDTVDPLNYDLRAWFIALPDMGGYTWLDLTGKYPLSTTGFTAPTSTSFWNPTDRLGGFGELRFNNSETASTTTLYADVFQSNDAFTISAWFKFSSLTNSPIVWAGQTTVNAFFLEAGALGQLYWGCGAINTNFRTYATGTVTTATWYNICVVKTASGDNGTLYLNGVAKSPSVGAIATSPNVNLTFSLSDYPTAGFKLTGMMDSMRIYRRSLSADEVATLYNEELLGYPNTLRWIENQRSYVGPTAFVGSPVMAMLAGWGNL